MKPTITLSLQHKRDLKWALVSITLLFTLISCGGGSGDKASEVNQAPKFTSNSAFSTLDNSFETGYQAVATDKEGDPITYSISGGIDGFSFLIEPESGAISFIHIPDFEHPHDDNVDNIYELEISATDYNDAVSKLMLKITVAGNRALLVIPVVVHVLYQENPEHESNITQEKILSQIDVLNKDFRMKNADLENVSAEFKSIVADLEIEFELASVAPDGGATDGITRTLDQTSANFNEAVYFTNSGGHDAWPTTQYLNIWLIDGADRNGNIGLGGRGQFPGGDPLTDGVVIPYQAFGTIAPVAINQNLHLGRTATHEIGHWFGLRHIDMDTNFMDTYVPDQQMLFFSEEQKATIHGIFAPDGGREELYENLKD
ncbi:MAG: hypothetical protein ABJK37_16500 [Paraglaciecola sp.]|uniref:hypothetical protein n=1 Tax=Paraglaciecola sp. TaxID=1920173 RepID=UPI003299A308